MALISCCNFYSRELISCHSKEIRDFVLPETIPKAETTHLMNNRVVFFPDGSKAGLTGLNTAFEEAYLYSKSPDRIAAKYILSRLSENNYIPTSSELEYEFAILKVYKEYLEAKEKSKESNSSSVK